MSLFRQRTANLDIATASGQPGRWGSSRRGRAPVGDPMRHSAVWACTRLRANLISSLPLDQYRTVDGIQVEVPGKPDVLAKPGGLWPGGPRVSSMTWRFASQMDLDRYGNTFGLITERSLLGYPARIDLVDASKVTVRVLADGSIRYRIGSKEFTDLEVWHERQYVVPGSPVGLSPLAAAAYSISQYASAQEFALDWFGGGAKPAAKMKNTARVLDDAQVSSVKARHEATTTGGGVLVFGKDWEYEVIGADASATQFLDSQKWSVADVCRFFDIPADMVDAGTSGSSVTYANVGQKMVTLLVTSIGPAVARREEAFSTLIATPRYVKLNTDALLRMDPETQARVLGIKVANRVITPDEWRALDERPPLTSEQVDQFAALFARTQPPAGTSTPPSGGTPA